MRIIPAIDIIEGKCVRLTKGDYATKKVYNQDPLEVAKEFEAYGIKYLHLVDLEGAKSTTIVNGEVLEKLASNTNLTIDFGGGLKSEEAIKMAFELGAKQVSLGSIAVKSPELVEGWIEQFGPDKIILGADVDNGKIAVNGWQETTQVELEEFVNKYQQKGIRNVICTDISRDGTLEGSAIALYQQLINQFPKINWIASGGVTSFEELGLLAKAGLEGAIIGKAIYENRITLKQLEAYVD